MLFDLLLFLSCIVLGGIAFVAVRRAEIARREAERCRRLARIGASVDGLAHDLNNLFTSIPYVFEEALEVQDDDRRLELQRDLEATINAASKLLQELHNHVEDKLSPDGGSIAGLVRLIAAGLRFRGPRIVMRLQADMRYGPNDLELLDRLREIMAEAIDEASALERCAVLIELNEDRLVIEHPIIERSEPSKGGAIDDGPEVVEEIGTGWLLRRRVQRRDDGNVRVRLEIARSRRRPQ
jgi:hypothetical protein